MRTIIVTRHPGAIEWLRKHHPELVETTYCCIDHEANDSCAFCHGTGVEEDISIRDHIGKDEMSDLEDARVVGILPFNLAVLAAEYYHLDMEIPAEARGKEISCSDMEKFGAHLTRYYVFDEDGMKKVLGQ